MDRTEIKDLHDHIEKEVYVAGWVDVRRDHGKLVFLDVRDRTGIIQTVALPQHKEAHETAKKLRAEWVVGVQGIVNKRPEKMVNADSPTGDIELELTAIEILSEAHELPFEKDAEVNLDTYLDHLPLTLRNPRGQAIFSVQSRIVQGFRDGLLDQGFTEIQIPKLVGGDAEGGAAVFEVAYFDKTAFLGTSPQLYKQIMVGVLERVFSTGNVYRAEKHATSRHLNEYTSLDFEMGFIKDHTDVMRTQRAVLARIMEELKVHAEKEFELLGASIPEVPVTIPSMTLREAQEIISKETGEDCVGEPDLEPAHERFLCEYAEKTYNSEFVYITHFPKSKRPFYTYLDEENPEFTKSFDLLFRGVEITTGGQRVHDYDTLVERIKEYKLDPKAFNFYLQAFKYGMPPEGGIGMGLERLTAKLLGLENVKEATLFPRDINRIDTRLSGSEKEE